MEGTTAMDFTVEQLTSIMNSITGVIDVTTMVGMLAAIFGVSAAFVLMWWGIRTGKRYIMSAVTKGRM